MEDSGGGRSRRYELDGETDAPPAPAGLTLGGILSIKQTPPYRIQDRTLLDLIRDDQTCGKEPKTTWKMFREKLRFKLAGSVCTTTLPTLASLVPITTDSNRLSTRHGSTQQNSTDESTWQFNSTQVANSSNVTAGVQTEAPVEESEQSTSTEENRGAGGDGGEPAGPRMSLMSLLEVDGSAYLDYEEEEEEAEEEEEEVEEAAGGGGGGGGGGYKYNNCCVCMVRHKGAAFIPCGHTFCRLCSRELFVQRASCPLCNNLILEILDIF